MITIEKLSNGFVIRNTSTDDNLFVPNRTDLIGALVESIYGIKLEASGVKEATGKDGATFFVFQAKVTGKREKKKQ